MTLHYAGQPSPDGLAQAFVIGEAFLAGAPCALVLGDNLFFGSGLSGMLRAASGKTDRATIFVHAVRNPEDFGVVSFDSSGRATSIEEKPALPKSRHAVTGLYFYDRNVVSIAKTIKPSTRGRLEITAVNNAYRERGLLDVQRMARGMAWLDAGTHDSLMEAALFIQTLEKRQGLKVGCLEEIAWRQGWINDATLLRLADQLANSGYGDYLRALLEFRR
jgi:glucose-1-phosphate thymidylyltransferase